MNNNAEDFHGSDIEKVAKYYKIEADSIVNFGGNVNPMGLQKELEEKLKENISLVTSYPDPDYTRLKKEIASYTNTEEEKVLLGNGSTELIANYIEYVNPKQALIVGPTYSEYESKLRSIGAEVRFYALEEKNNFNINIEELSSRCNKEIDILVMCNPNNPTATIVSSHQIHKLLDKCKASGIMVLIDETYMDFVENADEMTSIGLTNRYTNILVLRGYSKFFASPGLRLGYGVTRDIACHDFMKHKRHHWAINSLAAFAGAELISNQKFIKESRKFIRIEREFIKRELKEINDIIVYPTSCNFFLIKLKDEKSKDLFEYLIKYGLMVRNATSFPFLHGEYIRFCINSHEENQKLIKEIKKFFKRD